jgi:hypothetical protein
MSNVIFSRFEGWSLKTYYAPNHCWVKFWPLVNTRETPEKVKATASGTKLTLDKELYLQTATAPIPGGANFHANRGRKRAQRMGLDKCAVRAETRGYSPAWKE